jgi:hypothetical protein
METSRWMQDVIHPVTGERQVLEAGTEEELEKKIAEWVRVVELADDGTTQVDPADSPR